MEPLRVLYFGTYRANYIRNQNIIKSLRRVGVEVVECHETLWHGIEDRVEAASGGWIKPAFWWRVISTYLRLLARYRKCEDYDVMIIGYPGQFDLYLGYLLTRLRRKPMVWDVLMSIYLVALERNLGQRSALTLNILRRVEWLACRLPDRLIMDTRAYVDWFGKTHSVPQDRFRLVPIGADDDVFHPIHLKPRSGAAFIVNYAGTYIPNHGVSHILEAARLLRDETDIRFEMIGAGPDKEMAEAFVRQHHLSNVTFVDWVEQDDLFQHWAQSDVLLGSFGATPQSLITVHNKIYQGLAMAKPVITGDSLAVRENFEHRQHVYLCKRNDGQAIAEAICDLRDHPELCSHLSECGSRRFYDQFTIQQNGLRFKEHLAELLKSSFSARAP